MTTGDLKGSVVAFRRLGWETSGGCALGIAAEQILRGRPGRSRPGLLRMTAEGSERIGCCLQAVGAGDVGANKNWVLRQNGAFADGLASLALLRITAEGEERRQTGKVPNNEELNQLVILSRPGRDRPGRPRRICSVVQRSPDTADVTGMGHFTQSGQSALRSFQ